jgi:hypothetical protein
MANGNGVTGTWSVVSPYFDSGRILVDSKTCGGPTTDCNDITWDEHLDHTGLFIRISPDSVSPTETACETSTAGCELVVGFHQVSDRDSTDAGIRDRIRRSCWYALAFRRHANATRLGIRDPFGSDNVRNSGSSVNGTSGTTSRWSS